MTTAKQVITETKFDDTWIRKNRIDLANIAESLSWSDKRVGEIMTLIQSSKFNRLRIHYVIAHLVYYNGIADVFDELCHDADNIVTIVSNPDIMPVFDFYLKRYGDISMKTIYKRVCIDCYTEFSYMG
ncbi:MAG: hypothetical protein Faunusvirus44_2 [Faunusvirus sp.]|jgi:hypothetical protein|uniref:Uncharacterized protein n=1 Tax=Faunusvirus sp. TaxID=2487766 RepID=A0A3G4ZXU8_9VIRU|nr:MAG: hypothetical protein Faunusvirus44_2 [Faunusvirus sp.]